MPVALMVAAGTSAGDVWEVDADPKILLHGQQGGEMLSVATNPHYPHVFAALSAAGHVGIWNAITHKVGDMMSMPKVGIIYSDHTTSADADADIFPSTPSRHSTDGVNEC